jgi:hypothetical protein
MKGETYEQGYPQKLGRVGPSRFFLRKIFKKAFKPDTSSFYWPFILSVCSRATSPDGKHRFSQSLTRRTWDAISLLP